MTKIKRKRGRTGTGLTENMKEANPGVESQDREENAHGISRYNRMHAGGATKTLNIARHVMERLEKEGKHLHWGLANDKGRLLKLIEMGYEHVIDSEGNNIQRLSGGRQQFLMAIPKEWHEDDLKLKAKAARAIFGEETKLGDNEYSPTNQDSAVTRTEGVY